MNEGKALDVCLVLMPFAEVQRPSIGLGLLHAALENAGISSDIVHANLLFAEAVGITAYQAILSTPTDHLLGDWCFSENLFESFDPDHEAYLNLVLEVRSWGFPPEVEERKELVHWMRRRADAFLDELADAVLATGARVIGCSSVFQQHCAALALLKRIRALDPHVITLLGGGNCEGEMGLQTLVGSPWVDCVVSGEADILIVDLCRALLEHGREVDPAHLPYGAMIRSQLANRACHLFERPPRSMVTQLDSLPIPQYKPFFSAIRTSTLEHLIRPGLPAESSRGCWWGVKSHCTFCGLNGIGMAYRSKSAARVLTELAELYQRHGVRDIQFVDNILDMKHIDTVLRPLAEGGGRYSLFYETKANLSRDQLGTLARAGVHWIQPGIESLHNGVLRLIGKGNSAAMNVQLLKWCKEIGIRASWNLLCGFPGEHDAWYAEMAEWIPSICHLEPPSGVVRLRYDRFSPYHSRPGDYGLELVPGRAYRYIYPFDEVGLRRIAYSFEDAKEDHHVHRSVPREPGQQALQHAVQRWTELWSQGSSPPKLRATPADPGIEIRDTRPCAAASAWYVEGVELSVLRACDRTRTSSSLRRALSRHSPSEIDDAVCSLARARLVLALDDHFLSLVEGVAGSLTSA